jgi:ABC-2 type transport system permease protein
MTTLAAHSGQLTLRGLRALLRQPVYVAITLVQPMIWLLLFGQLFRRVVDLPGFGGSSYITYLTPGVVVMTALFASGWSGMGFIQDMERGVMDRLLVSPVRRGAMMIGSLAYQAAVTTIQSVIILVVGVLMGARYAGGLVGLLVVVACAVLVSASFASLSNALALLLRTQEALIGVANFLVLPLTFLSSSMIASSLSPSWIRTVATYNPIDWAVVASREALASSPDWGIVLWRLALLAACTAVMGWLATRSFRAYQRSV